MNALMASRPLLKNNIDSVPAQVWLARIRTLAMPYLSMSESIELGTAVTMLLAYPASSEYLNRVTLVFHYAIAKAEADCGGAVQPTGAVVQIGEAFKAFAEITSVIKSAKQEVFIVDPYMNETALTDFAIAANEGVKIRLLTSDSQQTTALRQLLLAGSIRWLTEHGMKRPLETRKASSRTLHDRVMFIDQTASWVLSQSIKDFAVRSPATVLPLDTSLVADKLAAYEGMWTSATPL